MPQKLVVPAYFEMKGAGVAGWRRIEEATSSVAIVIPDGSFPYLDTQNPEALPCVRKQFGRCQQNGQKVLGYVSTRIKEQGKVLRPIADVKARIDKWYEVYPSHIDGIYFDEGPMDADPAQNFYEQLIAEVKRRPARNTIMLAAPEFAQEWVMQMADQEYFVVLWEDPLDKYLNQYGAEEWWARPEYTNKIAHIVLGCRYTRRPAIGLPATNHEHGDILHRDVMLQTLALSSRRNAGLSYVVDWSEYKYSGLPEYFEAEAAGARDLCTMLAQAIRQDINEIGDAQMELGGPGLDNSRRNLLNNFIAALRGSIERLKQERAQLNCTTQERGAKGDYPDSREKGFHKLRQSRITP
jgi:hypothetical protein